jgi:hypothetical protein
MEGEKGWDNREIGRITISGNGNTVWVNSRIGCLARFCRWSSEFIDTNICITHSENIKYHWDEFVNTIYDKYCIQMPNEFKPKFVREKCNIS